MSKKADASKAREIIAEAEKAVSTWPEWKLRQFEVLSAGDYDSNPRAPTRTEQDEAAISL